MSKLNFILWCSALAVAACGHGDGPRKLEDCPYGKPNPVFSEQMPGVSAHRFESEAYSTTEEFVLGDTLAVALIQSGCEAPVQEFRFAMPPQSTPSDPAYWVEQCVDILYKMSALSAETAPLSAWALAMEAEAPNFILGESLEIQQGTYVKIDQISSADGVILLLILGALP